MKKNIYIVTPWYNTFSGGAEVAARTLAEECAKRGINTTVLTTCCQSPYSSWWEDSIKPGEEYVNGVKVIRFRLNKYGKEKYENTIHKQITGATLLEEDKENFYLHGITSDELVKYIKNLDDNNLVIMLPYFQALAYNVVINNPNKVSIMPCFHDEEQFYWNQISSMIKESKNIFYLSEPEKDMVIKNYGMVYGKKVIESKTVGLGVEIEEEKIKSGEIKFKELNLPKEYIVYVGRKDIGKGVLNLVNFHKELKSDIPLVFLGGGDESLVPKNNDMFIDLGFVDEDLKYSIISHSKVLVNLSNNESFSLVIMEAWLMGIPVIVSEGCDVTKYHCQKSNGGLWIKDSNSYKKSIELLQSNTDLARSMGVRGREYVEKNYNWSNVIFEILKSDMEVGI